MKEIKISETTRNEERENNIDFITISKLSSSMIFANKNHAIVYGGDRIGYTKVKLDTNMPLDVKKIFVMFQFYIIDNKDVLLLQLNEKYNVYKNLTDKEKNDSLFNFTNITLTSAEICKLLGKNVNKDNKKKVIKMCKDFADYMYKNINGICKTNEHDNMRMQPILYGIKTKERCANIEFYFVDFYILQTIYSNTPMFYCKNINNARSLRTYDLANYLVIVKYNNLMNVQNNNNDTITIRSIFEICDIGREEYANKRLIDVIKVFETLINSALKLIDNNCTWKYIKKPKSYSEFYTTSKIKFNIPIFNSRIEDLKTHIEKVGSVKNSTKQDTIDVAKSNVETQMIKANCNDKDISDTINKEVDIINEEFNMFRLEEF